MESLVRTWAHVPGIAWDASETCMEFKGCLNLCLSTMCWKRSLWTDHKLFASFVIPPPKCARKQWALRSISCPSKALLMLHKVKHTWAAGLRDGGGEQPAGIPAWHQQPGTTAQDQVLHKMALGFANHFVYSGPVCPAKQTCSSNMSSHGS